MNNGRHLHPEKSLLSEGSSVPKAKMTRTEGEQSHLRAQSPEVRGCLFEFTEIFGWNWPSFKRVSPDPL